jgi:3-methyladenine DNA glycosylase AlkD
MAKKHTLRAVRHEEVMEQLRALADPAGVAGQARFGITGANRLGARVTDLRGMARRLKKDHALAQTLWRSGVHEARLLATMVDDPAKVTEAQMERWLRAFDSWDLVDQACGNLFDRTPHARAKALEWSTREPEFQKRAGFSLMAMLAIHDKDAADAVFRGFLKAIERESGDERNFVRKAVNWALRQIGKRNRNLHTEAMETAERIAAQGTKPARWIAADAQRELRSDALRARLR